MSAEEAIERQRRRAGEQSEATNVIEGQRATEATRTAAAERVADERMVNQTARQPVEQAFRQYTWQQPEKDRMQAAAVTPARLPMGHAPSSPSFPSSGSGYAPAPPRFDPAPSNSAQPRQRTQSMAPESKETQGRPAWLASEELPVQPIPSTPADTIQGARERLALRWFALKGLFNGVTTPAEVNQAPTSGPVTAPACAPVLAVFSLAGGVGKTSLVATLGRAFSARSERVLLVDTAAYGLLPFFFGARDQRPGVLRTFMPPGTVVDAPIQMVTLDPESLGSEKSSQDMLAAEISKFSRGSNRVIVDLATASGATTRRVLRLTPTVLVPLVPDMNSVVSVGSIDTFFEHNGCPSGKLAMPFYVLNQFDPSRPLHLDVREVLREQLGERLLPFALRRTPAMSEALAEGMTALDYAPNSTIAEDFASLATWVKSLAAAANNGFRGVRWSER